MPAQKLPRRRAAGLCLALALGAGASLSAGAAEPDCPQAWFEPARTASQLGIDSFSQSPMLEGQGLPPVERRLPDDPVVVVPLESMGVYGGTARIIADDRTMFISPESLFTISPDHKTILPNLA